MLTSPPYTSPPPYSHIPPFPPTHTPLNVFIHCYAPADIHIINGLGLWVSANCFPYTFPTLPRAPLTPNTSHMPCPVSYQTLTQNAAHHLYLSISSMRFWFIHTEECCERKKKEKSNASSVHSAMDLPPIYML